MAQQTDWWNELRNQQFLENIRQRDCIPFIGPGASKPWIPAANVIANQWAQKYDYPLPDSEQLQRVAQFLAITQGGKRVPKSLLCNELRRIKPPDFSLAEYRNTPPVVFADLNLPIYITTNYDHFIEEALKARGKEPISDFCRWSEDLVEYANENEINPQIYKEGGGYKPKPNEPLVYHLHGDIDYPYSMVLTEKDFIDFVIFLNKEEFSKNVLPLAIRKPLSSSTPLLFVGYALNMGGFSLDFSVIFQTVVRSSEERVKKGISVQIMMPISGNSDFNEENVKKYLEQYTDLYTNLDVYWGDPLKFSEELRHQLDVFEGLSL
jgi:hypothetical protein